MGRARHGAIFLFALGLLFSPALPAQDSGSSIDPAFAKIHAERTAAMHSGNIDVYARYTTDDFWVVMPDGSVQSKQDRIAAMGAMKNAPASSRELGNAPPREEKMNVYGNTVVVSWVEAIQGKDARFTETWVKQGGTWKAAAAHVSMIQPKP